MAKPKRLPEDDPRSWEANAERRIKEDRSLHGQRKRRYVKMVKTLPSAKMVVHDDWSKAKKETQQARENIKTRRPFYGPPKGKTEDEKRAWVHKKLIADKSSRGDIPMFYTKGGKPTANPRTKLDTSQIRDLRKPGGTARTIVKKPAPIKGTARLRTKEEIAARKTGRSKAR